MTLGRRGAKANWAGNGAIFCRSGPCSFGAPIRDTTALGRSPGSSSALSIILKRQTSRRRRNAAWPPSSMATTRSAPPTKNRRIEGGRRYEDEHVSKSRCPGAHAAPFPTGARQELPFPGGQAALPAHSQHVVAMPGNQPGDCGYRQPADLARIAARLSPGDGYRTARAPAGGSHPHE